VSPTPYPAAMNLLRVHRDLALLLFAVVALAFPFLRQPFHMDDNFYMDMARNVKLQPLYPNDAPYVFEGHRLPDMGSHSHPPLVTYFLAALQQYAGEGSGKEWIYHLAALIFPVLAVWSFYFLAARFLARPLWAGMGLAACPLFLIMQHTLMTDVPTLAFWLATIAAFVWATETKSPGLYAASALFQFAAMFTSYHSVLLFPLLGFYQWRRRGTPAGWFFLMVPPALLAGWFGMNYFHYHRWLLGDTYGYIRSRDVAGAITAKLTGLMEYQGWLILFPFFAVSVFGGAWRGRLSALLLLASAYGTQLLIPQYRLSEKVIFVAGLFAGGLILIRMAGTLKVNSAEPPMSGKSLGFSEEAFLGLWYFAAAAGCAFLFTEGSARYILPLVPPAILMFFRDLEVREIPEYRLRHRPVLNSAMLASGSVVISLVWGLVLSQADFEFAGIYPKAAREFAGISGGLPFYYGGEWGFRYYMREAGAAQLPMDEAQVKGGSYIALPSLALGYDLPSDLDSTTTELQTLTYEVMSPFRLLDRQSHAGFYSTGWGLLPFGLSRSSLESIEIRQVNYLADQLPYASVRTQASVPPWPGYASVAGRRVLSLMMKPGTLVAYPWTFGIPVTFKVSCGVVTPPVGPGDYNFEIRQLGRSGTMLRQEICRFPVDMKGGWADVSLALDPGPGTLELKFSGPTGVAVTGAFAEPVLRGEKGTAADGR
jgi:hypothetical protein